MILGFRDGLLFLCFRREHGNARPNRLPHPGRSAVKGFRVRSASVSHDGDDVPPRGPLPLKVVPLDLDAYEGDVSPTWSADGRYVGLMVIAWRGNEPVGMLEVPLDHEPVSRVQVRQIMERKFLPLRMDAIDSRVTSSTCSPTSDIPRVTIVVATNAKRPAQLRQCIDSLTKVDYPDFEVLIVDNRSSDAEKSPILDEYEGVFPIRVVREPTVGISAARNRGLAEATGTVIAFTDDDTTVDQAWLRAIVGRMVRDPSIDCVTGPVLPMELETPAQNLVRAPRGPRSGLRTPDVRPEDGARHNAILPLLRERLRRRREHGLPREHAAPTRWL